MLHILGPEELGGFGEVPTKARAQAEATGRKLEDVMEEEGLLRVCNVTTIQRWLY
ncbi:hypothetical protein JB92DRAFT_1967473 [Gautieria morchelliformis]|nr:hypothetical protein JB92DRAFT_1967473 [Gautieria morchelliformis]